MKEKDDIYFLEQVSSVYNCANSLTLLISVNDNKGSYVLHVKNP